MLYIFMFNSLFSDAYIIVMLKQLMKNANPIQNSTFPPRACDVHLSVIGLKTFGQNPINFVP